jgi:hypothetical protein
VQHGVSASQDWPSVAQPEGVSQTPALHVPLQHGIESPHDCVASAQLGGAPQVPLVAPSGMLQTDPPQQSPSAVQLPLGGTHAATHVWLSTSHVPEQHCPFPAHVSPFGTQATHCAPTQSVLQQSAPPLHGAPMSPQPVVGTPHTNPSPPSLRQELGAQQDVSPVPEHVAPAGVHVGAAAVQWSTPVASGTHGAPLQHWSRNWQTLASPVPGLMQHAGSSAS